MFRALWPLALALALASCRKEGPSAPAPAEPKGPPAVDEAEPNDDSKSAQALATSTSVRAQFAAGAKADDDWFKLTPAAAALVRVEAAAVPADATLEAYDIDRNRILRVSAAAGEDLVVPNLACNGACYFRFAPAKKDGAGAYTATFTISTPGQRSEKEPNNRYVDAQAIGLGAAIDGFLAPSDDEDWYLLTTQGLAPDQVVSVTFTSPPDVRGELAVVRQSDQAPLGSWKASEPGQDLRLRNLSAPAAPDTAMFLVVRSASVPVGGGKFRRFANAKAAYTLEVKAMPGASNLEAEPNDEPARATVIDVAAPVRTGFLAPKGDTDWFTFTLAEPSIVRAELSGLDRVDFVLSAIDPARRDEEKDNELAKSDTGSLKEPEVLAGVALPAGENFLKVEGAWKKLDEKWVKDYENANDPYTLTLTIEADTGTHEREPNDKADRATTVEIGKDYKGYVHPAKDVDVWRLDVAQAANATLLLSGVPKLDLSITVRDANQQNDKGEFAIIGTVDRNKVEAEERLVVPFEAGAYLIEIREKGRESNPARPYTLSLK